MFQSVSELTTADKQLYRSFKVSQTLHVNQLKENHQPQRTKFSTVTYVHFIQNSNQMASTVNCN